MKTKLRIFCIFLCLSVVNNMFADILSTEYNSITYVGVYNGHKVYSVNENSNVCFSYYSTIFINCESVFPSSSFFSIKQ